MTIYRGKSGHFASKAEIAAIKAAAQQQPALPVIRPERMAYKGFNKNLDTGKLSCLGFGFEVGISGAHSDV